MSIQAVSLPSGKGSFTPAQFATAVEIMRPGLIKYASRIRPCGPDDAEDLVGEAIRLALLVLDEFDPEISSPVTWMNGVLRIVILRDREKRQGEPTTVPLIHALPLPARPDASLRDAVRPHLDRLPIHLRSVVHSHLDGWTQEEIAWKLRITRNTVANRIALAGQQLQCAFPDFEDEWDRTFFDSCCRHAVYHKPSGMASYWRHKGLGVSKPSTGKKLRGAARRRAALAAIGK